MNPTSISPDRWREVEALYKAAIEIEPASRLEFLQRACPDDHELSREVASLLACEGKADELLESPVWMGQESSEIIAPGTRVGSYQILQLLGRGGMGEVYEAEDSRLKRSVAIKVLRRAKGASEQEKLRFLEEARAASALNHPNIVQIYELESDGEMDCIVMELLRGQSLARLIAGRRLTIAEALSYIVQIASALEAAHAAGIVHRDLKPENMIVSGSGVLKILDFGIAKRSPESTHRGVPGAAGFSSIFGTPGYMSPEQVQGMAVDARSDIFSAGAVAYEMLTGKRAFEAQNEVAIPTHATFFAPFRLQEIRPNIPPELANIVTRCLQNDAALRYGSGVELAAALAEMVPATRFSRSRRRTLALAAVVLTGSVVVTSWLLYRSSRASWVRNRALPEIQRLRDVRDYVSAFDVIQIAQRESPADPELKRHRSETTTQIHFVTTPAGARVSYRKYGDAGGEWRQLGETPLVQAEIPIAHVQVRVEKDGFEKLEVAVLTLDLQNQTLGLRRAGTVPPGMVFVPERAPWAPEVSRPPGIPAPLPVPDFYIDKFEVTNRDFHTFLVSGGYQNTKYWRHAFRKDGRDIPFAEGISRLIDLTGRPGPSVWQAGQYPAGAAEHPVSGVSWYEAAAYCEFAGKALPTNSHWRKVGAYGFNGDILQFSNFSGNGPIRVGSSQAMSSYGAYDVLGNVREWSYNASGEWRYIIGGSWSDSGGMFAFRDGLDPFTRTATEGFRCALYPEPVPESFLAPTTSRPPDYSQKAVLAVGAVEALRGLYTYDKRPLETQLHSSDDTNPYWRREKVSYRAAYDGARIPAHLYLPKKSSPPYQTVLWVPSFAFTLLRSSDNGPANQYLELLLQSGRAVLHPVYKNTYERRAFPERQRGPNEGRDARIQYVKDIFRSIDFLETRPDIRQNALVYFGVDDLGGPVALALEPRLTAGILIGAELPMIMKPENDAYYFAPQMRTPLLLIHGRNDFLVNKEAQQALFARIGTSPDKKRHALLESGHVPHVHDVMKEVQEWLDVQFGPIPLKP